MTNIPVLLMPVIVAVGMTFLAGLVYFMATTRKGDRQLADGSPPHSFRKR